MGNIFDISDWILKNRPLYDIDLNDNLTDALAKIPDATLVGTDSYGYYCLKNGFRVGFS